MTRTLLLVPALAALLLAIAPSAGATTECQGFVACVPVAGPWVAVPVARGVPRPQVQYQLTCPRGFVVAGLDAELSDRGVDVSFFGRVGSPVAPGVTTSRSVVFVASYVGGGARAPTFRPHAGCIPSAGGGRRVPTGLPSVFPPGQPAVRRVATVRVRGTTRIAVVCRPAERLVGWYLARGFSTTSPPPPPVVAGLAARAVARGNGVVAVAHARSRHGVVQLSAVCAGGT